MTRGGPDMWTTLNLFPISAEDYLLAEGYKPVGADRQLSAKTPDGMWIQRVVEDIPGSKDE